MAENQTEPVVDEHDEESTNYKAPAPVAMDELLSKDKDDESLETYKKKLLGESAEGSVIIFPENPKKVIVQKLALVVAGREDVEMDLSGDISNLKAKPMIIKEGASYRIKIYFYVQREIVSGLKYLQKSYRKGILVDKTNLMVGSYGPKAEMHAYMTPVEDAPSGMIARGSYTIKSAFTDDDKHDHLSWEWKLEIKKDWE